MNDVKNIVINNRFPNYVVDEKIKVALKNFRESKTINNPDIKKNHLPNIKQNENNI